MTKFKTSGKGFNRWLGLKTSQAG